MVRIGPAFFDSVKSEKKYRHHGKSNFIPDDVLIIAPIILTGLIFAVIIIRLFYVQIVRSEYYRHLADQNRTRTANIPAPRGIILDRNGRELVTNSPLFKIIENGHTKMLSQDEAFKLISRGKNVQNDVVRNYLYKSAFAHVLGYIGPVSKDEIIQPEFDNYSISDYVGKMGLEAEYEGLLHGQNGKELYEVDAQGNFVRLLGRQEPTPGQNLVTTLNLDVQKSTQKAMDKVDRGAVVVSDPRDGGILAIYSKPNFDPNVFTHDKSYVTDSNYKDVTGVLLDGVGQPLLDRSIGGAYPPGSTFKLIAATAALQKGTLTADTQIEDTGILKVGTFSFGNWYFLQYGRTEGNLNIVGAIKRSNDIFFYKTAENTGVDYISGWAKTFGLGSKAGINLPGEVAGTVPTVEWKEKTIGEQWYLGDTYNYGIGQGFLLTTPLQVNMYTDVFANDGTLYAPHLLLAQPPKIRKQNFINGSNLNLVREGMAEACDTGGVAWPLFQFKVKNPHLPIDNLDYYKSASDGADMVHVKVACKTGTAETSPDKNPDAWITVFAPFNHPEIAVTVLVENGGEGSSIAGPIARDIIRDYFEKK